MDDHKKYSKPKRTIESWALNTLKKGIFYTPKPDKDITALAVYYKRKVLTERVVVIEQKNGGDPIAKKLTKVTILYGTSDLYPRKKVKN